MKQFIEQIKKNLESNGFPQKRVSFPIEKMYELADSKGHSFNKVLELLREEHAISHELETEKVVFYPVVESPFPDLDPGMLKQAMEMMKGMSPEQLQEIQDSVAKMSPEEKADIIKKGKDLGI
ncbi:MAG: hypothetical protein HN509_07150 [Halobacteriovoraceae bacterium]|jgi:hypothetical protein|nr:hypothetical protein [Halobacteriovoraceae bacterium]MBT5093471.1 hypothetical protein [Halobacteriovoraceae bacterium]